MCYEAFSNGNRDIVLIHDFQSRQKGREKWVFPWHEFCHFQFICVYVFKVIQFSLPPTKCSSFPANIDKETKKGSHPLYYTCRPIHSILPKCGHRQEKSCVFIIWTFNTNYDHEEFRNIPLPGDFGSHIGTLIGMNWNCNLVWTSSSHGFSWCGIWMWLGKLGRRIVRQFGKILDILLSQSIGDSSRNSAL